MSGTARTTAALLAAFPNNTSGSITPQNARDFIASGPQWDAPGGTPVPFMLRGTLDAASYFVGQGGVIGSGQSSGQRITNATALQAAITEAYNTNKFFELAPGVYEITSSTGLNIPTAAAGATGNSFVWRGSREGTIIRQFYATSPGAPILVLGDNSGATLMRTFNLSGFTLDYGASQTGFTSAQALVLNQSAWGSISDVVIGGTFAPYRAINCGGPAAGFVFSCTFARITAFVVQQDYWAWTGGGSTGCLCEDIYFSSGVVGTFTAIAGNFINFIGTVSDMTFVRLNCEWTSVNSVFQNGTQLCFGLSFFGLHLEGLAFTGTRPNVFSGGGVLVNSMVMQNCTWLTPGITGGNPSIVYMWNGIAGVAEIHNLTINFDSTGNVNTAVYLFDQMGIGDFTPAIQINGQARDAGGGNLTNFQFDTHMPSASFNFPHSWIRYKYGQEGSIVEKASLGVSATYHHYGQMVDATIEVPAVITSFTITLSPLQGATGNALVKLGTTLLVRRQSGTASGTLTVTNGGGAGGNLAAPNTASTNGWYQFVNTGTGANNWAIFTPVT